MLVISSATKNAYIALEYEGKKVFSKIEANCKQSENILVAVNNLLEEINLDIENIDKFGIIIGPGSFTGIRIGVALVKGLCAGKRVKDVLALSTLELMSKQIVKQRTMNEDFVCAIDALSNLVYIQTFDKNGKCMFEPELISKEVFDKLKYHKIGLEEENICEDKIEIDEEMLIDIFKELTQEYVVDIKKLEPLYLRKSQAEENLNKNKKS